MEAEKSPNVGKLRDVQEEVRNRDRQFSSLTNRGKDQLRAAGDTDIVLDSKVGELGRRWSMLQNMIMGIQDKLERVDEEDVQERFDVMLHWIVSKRAEIESIIIGRNLNQIKRQIEENCEFRYLNYFYYVKC